MKTFLKLIVLTLLLNLVRYFVGGPIEAVTIMEPMHKVMPMFPDVFDNDFATADFVRSLFYNYVMWFAAALGFHLMVPSLKGHIFVKSFAGYGVMCLFFIGLAAVYMNHYVDSVKTFYVWSMIDALIVFSVVAAANALLYPLFFKSAR